jgi:hypothetical protein
MRTPFYLLVCPKNSRNKSIPLTKKAQRFIQAVSEGSNINAKSLVFFRVPGVKEADVCRKNTGKQSAKEG